MLQVRDLTFSYNKNEPLLDNLSFSLNKGEHLCIMGESGCGKSTLLKIIYGLFDVQQGSLYWENTEILGPAYNLIPGMDFIKYVAQDFDLMPFTSVSDNIAHHLSRLYPAKSKKRTKELLEVTGMTPFSNQKVKTLSGGQKQRVAIARALAKEPQLLLLDEPFSQIDNFKKNDLRRKLFAYLKNQRITCIVATHDRDDALSFADQMIVIKDSKIALQGHPLELYKNPKSKYLAALFDDINEIEFRSEKKLFYPHEVQIVEKSNLKAMVLKTYFKGFYWLIEADLNDRKIYLNHPKDLPPGKMVSLRFDTK